MSQIFSKKHMLSFGNYLLSGAREQIISDRNQGDEEAFEREIFQVNDFDYDNWIDLYFSGEEHEEFRNELKLESFDLFKELGKYLK